MPLRVMLIHNFYQIPGGEDSIVRAELSMLKNNGVVVDLFSTTNDIIKGRLTRTRTAFQAVYNPLARRALARKLADFSPDVVHTHNFFPLLSPSIFDACLDAGVPSVLTLHNYRILCPTALIYPDEANRERSLRHPCWWTIPKKVYRNSAAATLALATMVEFHKRIGTWRRKVDRFIALTDWAKRTFTDGGLPAERISVKPNCVGGPRGLIRSQRKGGLFVGRVDEQKGVDVLLDAWKELDCPLRIIGDGPLSDLVRQSANDRIVYLGRQPPEVVQREMQAAQFLILPSIGYEMFPVTLLEAYSNQLPVIWSDLPSLAGLVEAGVTGLKFPPGDASGLAAQVRWATCNAPALNEYGREPGLFMRSGTPPKSTSIILSAFIDPCAGDGSALVTVGSNAQPITELAVQPVAASRRLPPAAGRWVVQSASRLPSGICPGTWSQSHRSVETAYPPIDARAYGAKSSPPPGDPCTTLAFRRFFGSLLTQNQPERRRSEDMIVTRRTTLAVAGVLTASIAAASVMRFSVSTPKSSGGRPKSKEIPSFDVPQGACDLHVHVIGDPSRFPMAPDRDYTPPQATADALREMLQSLHLDRVVIIAPSNYGTDNAEHLMQSTCSGATAREASL